VASASKAWWELALAALQQLDDAVEFALDHTANHAQRHEAYDEGPKDFGAGQLVGFLGRLFMPVDLCGVGGVFSIRRRTSSSRF
jgi:hypothetical protein